MYDVDDDWIAKVRAFVKDFPKTHADMCRLLNRNRIFIDRTKGIGVLTKEEAINLSCTGPIARASGVVRDLRKDEPYLAYKDFDFKVICAKDGDCYARYLVRMDEMLREPEDHPPGHREPAGRAGERGRRTARRCCPTRWRSIAASRA